MCHRVWPSLPHRQAGTSSTEQSHFPFIQKIKRGGDFFHSSLLIQQYSLSLSLSLSFWSPHAERKCSLSTRVLTHRSLMQCTPNKAHEGAVRVGVCEEREVLRDNDRALRCEVMERKGASLQQGNDIFRCEGKAKGTVRSYWTPWGRQMLPFTASRISSV